MLVATGDVHPVGALCSPWFRVQRVREACPRRLASAAPEASRRDGWVGAGFRQTARGAPSPASATPSRQRITRRPRRTIGRLCCPIARTRGVRYAGGLGWGSDPDAKPACGTPRAGRRAAAVAPSFSASWVPRLGSTTHEKRGTAGQQDGCPEAPTGGGAIWRASTCWRDNNNGRGHAGQQDGRPEAAPHVSRSGIGRSSATSPGPAHAGTDKTTNNSNKSRPKSARRAFRGY